MKEKELERLTKRKEIEKDLYNKGFKNICGIDEAGRGPLAGPVVIAGVIMPQDSMIEGVNDSVDCAKEFSLLLKGLPCHVNLINLNYVKEKGCKNGYVMWPVRTAVSGKQMTPGGATELMEVLGKEESLARLRTAIEKLEKEL